MRKKADLKTSSKKYQKILSVDRNRRNIYTRRGGIDCHQSESTTVD